MIMLIEPYNGRAMPVNKRLPDQRKMLSLDFEAFTH